MEEGFNHPMGPFRLNDLTGINLAFDGMQAKYKATGVKPDMYDIYEDLVKRGRIGRTAGAGFYDYN
jgi:3-hydroxybutyryl-CoA dehydrogenase